MRRREPSADSTGGKARVGGVPAILLFGIILPLMAACEAYPPEIVTVSHRLVVFQDQDTTGGRETLSFFAIIRDRDGKDDPEALYIMHDSAELYWYLHAGNWTYREIDGELWLGSNGLEGGPLSSGRLPRGTYRILLVDQAGQRGEATFSLVPAIRDEYRFAAFSVSAEGKLDLDSPYQLNTLFFFDAGGNVLKTAELAGTSFSLDSLWGDSQWRGKARSVRVYSYDIQSETGFMTWTQNLP